MPMIGTKLSQDSFSRFVVAQNISKSMNPQLTDTWNAQNPTKCEFFVEALTTAQLWLREACQCGSQERQKAQMNHRGRKNCT